MDHSQLETYRTAAESLTGLIPSVDGLRSSALARLQDRGLPTARSEAFRYTSTKAFSKAAFGVAGAGSPDGASLPPVAEGTVARYVFVNGRYSEDLSEVLDEAAISSLRVRRLANHLEANPDRSQELEAGADGLALLNTALMQDGLFLSLPTGSSVEGTIELLQVMTGAEGSAAHPRILIDLGEKAELAVLERVTGDDTAYWFNPVTQIRQSEGSSLSYARLFEAGEKANITARTYLRAGTNVTFRGFNGLLSGAQVRTETQVKALGEGSDLTVDGVSLASTGTRHDALTHLDHQVPRAESDQIYRAVSAARAVSSFQGKVTVAVDAQETEANQSFKALVLDRSGEANAKPELEILADDVKCAHGATIGELDQSALFYLTSRGIDPATARGILIRSFLGDALVRFEGTSAAALIEERINAWFDAKLKGPELKGSDNA